ncbi:MAG: hypothetical protein INR64_01545 [Caulobacteraceae bacterium]|nr:hypothetical protein [Caulobacter sp.]
MSRQAGLYERYVDGQAITPILHLPGGKLETGPPPLRMSLRKGESVDLRQFDEECEEQLDKDLLTCQIDSAMYGRGKKKKQIYAIRRHTAMERYSECLMGGV